MTKNLDESLKRFEKRQIIFSALGLLILILTSIVVNRIELTSVANESARFVSDLMQYSDFREIGMTLEQARRDYFKEIHYVSHDHERSFDLPASSGVGSQSDWLSWLTSEKVSVPVVNPLNADQTDHIVYVYNRLRFVPFACLIWALLVLVSIPQTRLMKCKIVEQWEREMSLQKDRAQALLAKEIRHNLRSPLAALMRIPGGLPESVKRDRDLLQSTINQIKALIAQLGPSSGAELVDGSSMEIYDTLIQAAQEASVALPSGIQLIREIDDAIVSANVDHIPHELRAAIGNIVANAADAIAGHGTVILKARDTGDEIEVEVQDTGHGIQPGMIDRIFDEGFTHGKSKGSGTGLFHAKRWVEAWGGSIVAKSKQGELTGIIISLPIESRAKWYVPRIRLSANQPIFVVEDQESARRLWEIRFDEAGINHARICSSADELRTAIREFVNESKLAVGASANSAVVGGIKPALFFDYHLGPGATGLDLLSEIDFAADRFLVTGHFDDAAIRRRCDTANVYLLPKSQLPDVPIVVG